MRAVVRRRWWKVALCGLLCLGAAAQQTARLLGYEVRWSAGRSALELIYTGEPDTVWMRDQHGTSTRMLQRPVWKADGSAWDPVDLQNQVQKNMQGDVQFSRSDKVVPQRVKLSAKGYGWDTLRTLPYAVRFAARRDLIRFTRSHLKMVKKRNADFRHVEAEDVEGAPGFGHPGVDATAEKLLGAPAPEPFHLLYYPRGEAPDWTSPGLIVVHATRALHFPSRAEEPTERLLASFRRRKAPVALLVETDRLGDATY